MKTSGWTLLVVAAAVFGIACSGCDKNKPGPQPSAPPGQAQAPAEPPAPATGEGALRDVPGMDFSALAAPAQRELAAVFSDEFCYCGCPHTLGQCLKAHPGCRHAKRMASLAAAEAAAGVPSTEIIVMLGRYYQSFRDARARFTPDARMCLGPQDAKVTLYEFSDFECPYCAAAAPLLEQVAKRRKDTRFCYAPFPLPSHANALPAAQAALFARDAGKFWALHDLLFAHQAALSREKILELASGLGLERAGLEQALEQGRYLDELRALKESAHRAGVDHTPTVYVNGRQFILPFEEQTLHHTIDDELEWQANGGAWAQD